MKLHLERRALADTLTWISQAIPRNPAHPVLGGVHLAATDTLTLTGTDWDTTHTSTLDANIGEPGTAVVSGRYLRDVVAAIRDTTITLHVDGNELVIAGERAIYRTPLLPVEDYPKPPQPPKAAGTVNHGILAAAVAALRPAVNDNPPGNLAVLSCFRIESSTNALDLVATDRFTLMHAVLDWDGKALAANVVARLFEAAIKGMTGDIAIGHDKSILSLADGTRTVTMRLVLDDFPPRWRELIRPAGQDAYEVIADTADARDALTRIAKLIDVTEKVDLQITEAEIELAFQGQAKSVGSGRDYLTAVSSGTGSYTYSPAQLADAIAAMPSDQFRIGVHADPKKPFVIRPVGNDDRAVVVMPAKR